MFRPYLAILSQFTFLNRRTLLGLSRYISVLLHIVVHTKMCLSENETVSPSRIMFLLRRPCLCPLRAYVPAN
jgi:hypothetical protein